MLPSGSGRSHSSALSRRASAAGVALLALALGGCGDRPDPQAGSAPPFTVAGPEDRPVLILESTFPTVPDVVDRIPEAPGPSLSRTDWEASWTAYNGPSLRGGARTVVAGAVLDSVAANVVREGLDSLSWLIPESVVSGLPESLAVPVFQSRRLLLEARAALNSDLPQTALFSYLTAADGLLELTPRARVLALMVNMGRELDFLEARSGGDPDGLLEPVRQQVEAARALADAGDYLGAMPLALEARAALDALVSGAG